jgi:hypothetical protein
MPGSALRKSRQGTQWDIGSGHPTSQALGADRPETGNVLDRRTVFRAPSASGSEARRGPLPPHLVGVGPSAPYGGLALLCGQRLPAIEHSQPLDRVSGKASPASGASWLRPTPTAMGLQGPRCERFAVTPHGPGPDKSRNRVRSLRRSKANGSGEAAKASDRGMPSKSKSVPLVGPGKISLDLGF